MRIFLGACIASLFLCGQAQAEERILDFNSTITVNRDASLDVTENIRVLSEGDKIRHGIYRDFPTRHKDRSGLVSPPNLH